MRVWKDYDSEPAGTIGEMRYEEDSYFLFKRIKT